MQIFRLFTELWWKFLFNACDSSVLCDTLLSHCCCEPISHGNHLTALKQSEADVATPCCHTGTAVSPSLAEQGRRQGRREVNTDCSEGKNISAVNIFHQRSPDCFLPWVRNHFHFGASETVSAVLQVEFRGSDKSLLMFSANYFAPKRSRLSGTGFS